MMSFDDAVSLPSEDSIVFFCELSPRHSRIATCLVGNTYTCLFSLRSLQLPPCVLAYLLERAARALGQNQTKRILPCSAT